jgi:hypothetical protein
MSKKYTEIIMAVSGIAMIIIGIGITFFTNEIIKYLNFGSETFLIFQIIGAFYFAFGMLNWQAKANLIGGIYSKPVAMVNFLHFFIVSISLLKSSQFDSIFFTLLSVSYLIFALLFGYIFFTNPKN